MPGWAGSSWYYLRYMDPHNADRFVGEDVEKYWGQVDLYMGGAEHATGHLLYSRFWYLFLKDLGLVTANEPFQKLINQGMILGVSEKILRRGYTSSGNQSTSSSNNLIVRTKTAGRMLHSNDVIGHYVSADIFSNEDLSAMQQPYIPLNVPIEFTTGSEMSIEQMLQYLQWKNERMSSVFVCQNGYYIFYYHEENDSYTYSRFEPINEGEHPFKDATGIGNVTEHQVTPASFKTRPEVEKMSKSKYNVVNPDVLIDKYGADALRLYEMFLGPLEQYKPWNTNGISGVATFLKKFWRLFHPEDGALAVTDEAASPAELKTLHRVIQKVAQDIDKFSFNTSVSTFMIAVNELTALGTRKRAVLEPLVLLLSPFAPHLAEELWEELGHAPGSISHAAYPEFREEYLVEANVTYPVAINGKVRDQRQFAATATAAEIEAAILESDFLARFGDGKTAKKVVVVPGRMVNVVV
jgi:leucyl-tRNA synthetase